MFTGEIKSLLKRINEDKISYVIKINQTTRKLLNVKTVFYKHIDNVSTKHARYDVTHIKLNA